MLESVIIIGAGQAGCHAAAALRQEGYAGALTLVSDEPDVPYQRPPLSKGYLLDKVSRDGLRLRSERFYAEHQIELVHARATTIDRTNRRVLLHSGEALTYGHLILAIGAHNRVLAVPGSDLDGIFGLRTVADADALKQRLVPSSRVVVVGAGFVGLELAATARIKGASVRILELSHRAMARSVSTPMSETFERLHREHGVLLSFRQGLAKVLGSAGKVAGVLTTDGEEIEADIILVGVGVLPNTGIASEAGLEIENGIKVDSHLVTSDPNITAIGDCCFFPTPRGHGIRLESVQNATDQARTVAARLTGKHVSHEAMPWFWSDQYDRKLQIAGLSTGYDNHVLIGNPDAFAFSVLCFERDKLVAVESLNRPGDHISARRLLERDTPLSPREAQALDFALPAFEARTR